MLRLLRSFHEDDEEFAARGGKNGKLEIIVAVLDHPRHVDQRARAVILTSCIRRKPRRMHLRLAPSGFLLFRCSRRIESAMVSSSEKAKRQLSNRPARDARAFSLPSAAPSVDRPIGLDQGSPQRQKAKTGEIGHGGRSTAATFRCRRAHG